MSANARRLLKNVPVLLALLPIWSGCDRDARLAGQKLREVTVETVTHYGVALDQEASPEQVAYVLLRAIHDDFLAEDETAREAALDKQFDVCAANELVPESLPDHERREMLYRLVHRWTPAVAHYVHGFETEWEKAQARFTRLGMQPSPNSKGGGMECQILMELEDPGGDPNARVLLAVGMIQDNGYWRVIRLAFAPNRRTLGSRSPAPVSPAEMTPISED